MPTEPTWEETTAVEEPTWDNTTAEQETASPGFLGPTWPAQEGEAIAEPDPGRERKRQELANQMRLARAERGLSDVIESFLGGAARAVEPLTPAGLMNQPTRIAGAIAGKTIPDIYQAGQPLVNVPQPTGTGFLAGLGQLGAQTLSGLTTPEMVVTAPAFPVSGVARALTAGEMAATLPESISRGGEVLRAPEATVAEKVVAAGQPLVTAAMVKALTKAERILPQAAEAVRETKGVSDASEISKTAEVHGDVRPLEAPPSELPVEGSRPGVQPQAEGRLPEAEAVTPARTEAERRRLLLTELTPEQKLAEQAALDEALGQETAPQAKQPRVTVGDLSKIKAQGAYSPFTGAVTLDKSEMAKLSPEERAAVVRHELAHKIETESELWQQSDDFLWRLWESDRNHPIWDYMGQTTGRVNFDNSQSPEIIAALYAKEYPTGKFTVERPVPYEWEGEVQGPQTYPIPPELMSVLDKIEAKLGIWKKKQARKPTPPPKETPTVPSAAEPSIPTPAQGSQLEPISKTTTPQQGTQALVTPEPFLGKTKAEWTPEYYKSLSPENRRAARAQVIGALATEGGKTKVTQESKPPVVLKAIHELLDLREKKKAATPPALIPPEPPTIALQAGLGIPGIEKLDRKFDEMRQGLATLMRAGPQRRQMDQTFDATDNMANIVARQATNQLRLNGKPIELEAIYPFIEAKGDINRLQQFITQATGKNDTAVAAAQYAQAHWNDPHFQALAARAKAISDAQIGQEQAAGINTEYREAYLPHSYDRDLMMGFNRPFVIGGGGSGMRTGFKKGRTFETIYDAIEAGYPVKTLNAADTLESRIRSGQKLINRVEWADSFRHVTDPTDGQPIVTSLERHARQKGKPGWESPPAGYARRTIIPGVDVAIHEGYTSLFDALTGTSRIAGSVPGKLVLEAEGALKHGLLLFDTYHVSRILQKEAALVGPTKMGWRKGLTLLEYSDADLNAALREGFITPEMANFARANRADAELLIRSGLNVGRIQENLYNSFVRQIPGIGRFNKWVFEKMTRGAMLQSGLIELERVQRDFGLTRQEAAMKVSRDLNAYFGNLGRQGIFKSSTAQDVARIVALAPQWVESMLRTEIGSVGKAVIDPIKYRKLAVSSLPLGVGTGLAAYFVATQILNMVTRGHPTWQNPEKGHKLDAWIPDFTGKTGGYFLSPFSVPAEVTHDMIRYARTEPDTIAAASRILSNKQSPLYRATKTLLTGKDWTGEKLIGSWERAKAASINLVPAPIGAAPLIMGEKYPGQTQRQITASLGIKTEPAPTAVQQIRELKKNWGLNNPNPKIQHQFEQALKAEYGKSDYDDLRRALSAGDMKKAGEAYDALIAMGKKRTDINDAVSWYTGGKETANGVYQERKIKPIAGQISESAEAKFKASLTPEERKIYSQAIEERKRIYARFLELLKTR